jgi:DNA-binding transcriptional ArsR family regulator
MGMRLIVDSADEGSPARNLLLADRPDRLSPLSHPEAWRILVELGRKPDYAGAVAKRLRMHEQTVYYHIHRLAKAGLIRIVREERRQGAVSRIYAPAAEAFGVELPAPGKGGKAPARRVVPERVRSFLEVFLREGGLFVIGSPYQHGPYLTVARDSPYAVEFGMFLGGLGTGPGISVRLDTEVKAAGLEKRPLILVGGPVANIVALDLNPHLKVSFDWQQAWRMRSSFTGREYAEEGVGLLAKIPNPWNPETEVAMFSGLHHTGTAAAVLALTAFSERVLRDYVPGKDFYRIVQGLDRDGDGRMDSVEVLE